MDLEYLLRACWRRKRRVLAFMVIFAVILGVGVSKMKPLKYAATEEIAVYPSVADSAAMSPYDLDPDRYVATQVAVVDGFIPQVATKFGVAPGVVGSMVSVKQSQKTDVVDVKATSASPALSRKVASALAQ